MNYQGITHGHPTWRWYLAYRRRVYCPRGRHLFDEVWAAPNDHYLSCDACDLGIYIAKIDKEYVK